MTCWHPTSPISGRHGCLGFSNGRAELGNRGAKLNWAAATARDPDVSAVSDHGTAWGGDYSGSGPVVGYPAFGQLWEEPQHRCAATESPTPATLC